MLYAYFSSPAMSPYKLLIPWSRTKNRPCSAATSSHSAPQSSLPDYTHTCHTSAHAGDYSGSPYIPRGTWTCVGGTGSQPVASWGNNSFRRRPIPQPLHPFRRHRLWQHPHVLQEPGEPPPGVISEGPFMIRQLGGIKFGDEDAVN